MAKQIRKRYFVSEGELFLLWGEVEQIRKQETRDAYKKRFKDMMKEAQEVELVVKPKTNSDEGADHV